MDEWFVHFEVNKNLVGTLRVPKDQVEKLQVSPIEISIDGKVVMSHFKNGGPEDNGRILIQMDTELPREFESLDIRVPEDLLDENQSLVGFLAFSGSEPTTLLIPPGGHKTFSSDRTALSTWQFFQLGGEHILTGYDHLLFLFCLLVSGGTLRHFAWVLTAFTLGHSLTLAASVLGYISLPSNIVEATIALSIVAAAALNFRSLEKSELRETQSSTSRVAMAGGFGLIHGLGFAVILNDIGIQGGQVLAPLIAFNLGIEASQLTIALCCYPFLIAAHRSKKRRLFVTTSSSIAILFGSFWFCERIGLI